MLKIPLKINISSEVISAIFIIVLISLFILSNFTMGFSLPIYAVTILGGGLIALFYPRSGLYAIAFSTFVFERFFTLQPIILGRVEYKIYPLDVILLAIVSSLIFRLIFKKTRLHLKKIDYGLVGFIFLTTAYFIVSSFILKNDFELSFSSFKNYAIYSLFYFVVIGLIQTKQDLVRLMKFALAGAVGIIFFVFYGIINGSGLWSEFTPLSTEGVRLLAFTHAFYSSLVLLGVITFLIFQKSTNKHLYFLTATWIVGIVGSMMRHLWVGLIVSMFVLYSLISKEQKRSSRKFLFKLAVIIIIAGMLVVYLSLIFPHNGVSQAIVSSTDVITQRISSLFYSSGDESIFWRNIVWREGIRTYGENFFWGTGLGNRIYVETESYRDFVELRNIHNSFLSLLIQMGILPMILLVTLVAVNLKKLFSKIRIQADWVGVTFFILIIYYLIVALFQPYLETNLLGIFFWIMLGCIRCYNFFLETYENTRN